MVPPLALAAAHAHAPTSAYPRVLTPRGFYQNRNRVHPVPIPSVQTKPPLRDETRGSWVEPGTSSKSIEPLVVIGFAQELGKKNTSIVHMPRDSLIYPIKSKSNSEVVSIFNWAQ